MEFNDGSQYVVLNDPEAQVKAGHTLYGYRACSKNKEGNLYVDHAFEHHRNLRTHFKATVIYQFAYIQFSPESQAEFFFDALGGSLNPGEMICLDLESEGGFTAANVLEFARRWLAIVEPALKTKAWIYTGKVFADALLPVTKDRVVWAARYSTAQPEMHYDAWQYAQDGPFPGASSVGDISRTNLSVEDLLARCGVASPKEPTVPKYTYEPTKEQVEALLNWHRSQLGKGQYEFPQGSNKTIYGEMYGFNGVAWCCIGASCGCKAVGSPFHFASTWEARRDAERHGVWSQTPKPGMGAMHVSSSTTGHWGTVEFVHSNGDITTIEYNTSPDSSGNQRDGDGVYRKRRSRSYWAGFVAYPWPVVSTPEPIPTPKPKEEDMGPAIVRTSEGRILRYVVGGDKAGYEFGRPEHPETKADGWRKIGGVWTSGLSAAPDENGGVRLDGRGTDGHLWEFIIDKSGTVTARNDLGGYIYAPA